MLLEPSDEPIWRKAEVKRITICSTTNNCCGMHLEADHAQWQSRENLFPGC